ncbi:Hpt domain-containing protein [Marivita sp. GX14005]|uniref:Hpt domain-containing protein n=1 Tax=Marivita sp. GX14005 TaxID=2942276 RepID=UPI0020199162|nr:Hpt domain-containing protein [Marivita sp. GX14005]MCL3881622.1 Hpt domain-containing protein [Marivita sp. GX14005]
MIDWTRVAELRSEIGADDFDEVAELFLMEVEDTLSRLDTALHDPPHLRELLHFLKGSALNLGFHEVSEMCSGEAPDIAALKSLYHASRASFEAEYGKRFAA